RGDEAVLIGDPDTAIAAQEGRAGTLLADEAERAVQQSGHEPLEAYGYLVEPPTQPRRHPIDHAAADERLAHSHVLVPVRPVREQIIDAHGEIMIGRQQPAVARDDAVAIVIGVAAAGDVEAI